MTFLFVSLKFSPESLRRDLCHLKRPVDYGGVPAATVVVKKACRGVVSESLLAPFGMACERLGGFVSVQAGWKLRRGLSARRFRRLACSTLVWVET